MDACILTIGDELLEGKVDTNSAWMSQALDRLGWRVVEVRHCRDDITAIIRNLDELSRLAPLVLTTGGLGPTTDDLTTEAVAQWTGLPLELHEDTWTWIQARFAERNLTLPPSNIRQAYYPRGALPLQNRQGTAMGYLVEARDSAVAVFPGVPREMKGMFEQELAPVLRKRHPDPRHKNVRTLKVFGYPESAVNQALAGLGDGVEGFALAYLAHATQVDIVIKVTRVQREEAEAVAETLVQEARGRLDSRVYGEGDDTLSAVVGRLLRQQGLSLTVAESCTGGMIGRYITDTPGSGDYFAEGLITYSNAAKQKYLGVRSETLAQYGAVSAETCEEMLLGLLSRTGQDLGIAVTGIAGPDGGSPEKPVGLVYIAWGDVDGYEVRPFQFHGAREDIRLAATLTALDRVRRFLLARDA